jgi:hypothetical protein
VRCAMPVSQGSGFETALGVGWGGFGLCFGGWCFGVGVVLVGWGGGFWVFLGVCGVCCFGVFFFVVVLFCVVWLLVWWFWGGVWGGGGGWVWGWGGGGGGGGWFGLVVVGGLWCFGGVGVGVGVLFWLVCGGGLWVVVFWLGGGLGGFLGWGLWGGGCVSNVLPMRNCSRHRPLATVPRSNAGPTTWARGRRTCSQASDTVGRSGRNSAPISVFYEGGCVLSLRTRRRRHARV